MGPRRVERGDGLPADTGHGQLHQMQPGAAAAVDRDDRNVGDVAVGHGKFRSAQAPCRRRCVQLRGVRRARPFRHRKCRNSFTGSEFRQPGLLLPFRPEQHDRLGRQIHRRRERNRRDGTAEFLRQHADRQAPQADAAIRLGDRGAGPAHLGDSAPQIRGIGFGRVQDAAWHGGRATVGQEAPRLVAQLKQLVGEFEVHRSWPFPCRTGLLSGGREPARLSGRPSGFWPFPRSRVKPSDAATDPS